MMRRVLPLVVGCSVALSVAIGLLAGSTAHAAPAAEVPMSVRARLIHGPDSPALEQAIAYWNGLAGRTVLAYVGMYDAGVEDPQAVAESVADLAVGLAGTTQGNVGLGPLVVRIDTKAQGDWVIWAHELGHTLGLGHHDEAGYDGVMRSGPEGYRIRSVDDQRLVALFQ